MSCYHPSESNAFFLDIKGALMQSWKFYYMFGFTWKQYPEFLLFVYSLLFYYSLFILGKKSIYNKI